MISTFEFLAIIKAIISEHNVSSTIVPKGNVFELVVGGNNNVKKMLKYLYTDASIYLQRKYNKALDSLDKMPQDNWKVDKFTADDLRAIVKPLPKIEEI